MHGECPESGKERFATALAAHLVVRQACWRKRAQKRPCRVYFCEQCQGYHVTSTKKSGTRRERLQYLHRRVEVRELSSLNDK